MNNINGINQIKKRAELDPKFRIKYYSILLESVEVNNDSLEIPVNKTLLDEIEKLLILLDVGY